MNGITRGYFWSILTMMGAPFLLMGSVAFFIWKTARRVDSRNSEDRS